MKRVALGTLAVVLAFALAGWIQGAQAAEYQMIQVDNGGTISGKVMWGGSAPPEAEKFPINKNPEFCDLEKTGFKKSPRLLVSESGGVANTVVYLEAVAQGKDFAGMEALLDQKGCEFVPHVLVAPLKSKLALKSSDSILHNTHMYGAASYNIPFPEPDRVLEKPLRKEGLIEIVCDAGHGWMSSYIHVVPHPYYVVTDQDGNFTLENVPPGTYVIKAWHEGWKVAETTGDAETGEVSHYKFNDPVVLQQDVTVEAGGAASVEFKLPESG